MLSIQMIVTPILGKTIKILLKRKSVNKKNTDKKDMINGLNVTKSFKKLMMSSVKNYPRKLMTI